MHAGKILIHEIINLKLIILKVKLCMLQYSDLAYPYFLKSLLSLVPSSSCICPNFLLQYKLIDLASHEAQIQKTFCFSLFCFPLYIPKSKCCCFYRRERRGTWVGAVMAMPSVNALHAHQQQVLSLGPRTCIKEPSVAVHTCNSSAEVRDKQIPGNLAPS